MLTRKKLKLGSSNCLKFTEMINSTIITLFCIILISFAIPSRGPFWLLRGCVHNPRTEVLAKLGSLEMKNEQNVAVSFKVLHALFMLTTVLQGQANLNVCANKLARGLDYCRLPRTKMITMQLRQNRLLYTAWGQANQTTWRTFCEKYSQFLIVMGKNDFCCATYCSNRRTKQPHLK